MSRRELAESLAELLTAGNRNGRGRGRKAGRASNNGSVSGSVAASRDASPSGGRGRYKKNVEVGVTMAKEHSGKSVDDMKDIIIHTVRMAGTTADITVAQKLLLLMQARAEGWNFNAETAPAAGSKPLK
jgi:hypothetical protein